MVERAMDVGTAGEFVLSQWKPVLEQMPAGVMVARAPDGRVVFGNRAAERVWRQPLPEAANIGAYAFWRGYHPDGRPYAASEWPLARSLVRGEEVVGEEIEVVRGDGTRATLSVSSNPIRSPSGQVIAAVVTFTEVTDRKRQDAGRRFLAEAGAVLSSSLDYTVTLRNVARLAVPTLADWCVVDLIQDGKLRRVAVEHVDREKAALAAELAERYPTDLTEPMGIARVMREGRSQLVNGMSAKMLRRVSRDEEHFRVLNALGLRSVMVVPLQARGRVLGDITLIAAESGRTFTAEDLALAEELATLAALAIDNARLYDESQSANRAKADFLSVISHELRTPLTAVIGYAELLALGIPEALTEKQGEQVERIEIAARHLLQLIEEILTITSLEAGAVTIRQQRIRLSELFSRAEAITRPLALEKRLELRVSDLEQEIELSTDPDRLLQVLLNLLSNAVKFTEAGAVELSARLEGDWVEASVRDTGIGITSEEQDRIFDAFWQVEQPITRRTGGTGLGLTISRRLLELLGGELRVESGEGAGSTFTVRVPMGL